jgi:hypothetical protein
MALRLNLTPHSWVIEKRKLAKGGPRWEPIRWYQTPQAAVKGLLTLQLSTNYTPEDPSKAIEAAEKRVMKAIQQ